MTNMLFYVGLEDFKSVYRLGEHALPMDFIEDLSTACFLDTDLRKIIKVEHDKINDFLSENKVYAVRYTHIRNRTGIQLVQLKAPLIRGLAYPSDITFKLKDFKNNFYIMTSIILSTGDTIESHNNTTYAYYKGFFSGIYAECFRRNSISVCCCNDRAILLKGLQFKTNRYVMGYDKNKENQPLYGVYKIDIGKFNKAIVNKNISSYRIEDFIDVVNVTRDISSVTEKYKDISETISVEEENALKQLRKEAITEMLFNNN